MAAEAIAGATPFGWAQLGLSALGGLAKGTPAGPSSADALFGPSLLNNDSSGWLVNIGEGARSDLNNSQRGAPNQTPVNTYAPGGYAAPIAAPGNTAAALGGALANLPWVLIIGGVIVGLVVWKKA
ncbi:hypothetical protein [Acidovorax delafieldii]|uniref:hypothetical protein n=1 Tax=Acidovorax delafieldii TaxID=47920 RepID=UPI003ECFB0BB